MRWTRVGITLTASVAALSALVAGLALSLLLTSPVTVAAALEQRTIAPVVRQLASVFVSALRGLMACL